MRVAMIGAGYVGLVSGACFSEFGVDVLCVDKDQDRIERLRRGEVPIFEPGLDALVETNAAAGRLRFGTDLAAAVADADAVFIAVGTPSRRGDGHADLSFVYAAAEEIAHALKGYTAVVTKSTVPVGTGRKVAEIIRATRPGADFDMVSNPEFLREGSAINDFMRPDRVVVGVRRQEVADILQELYDPFLRTDHPFLVMSPESAELIISSLTQIWGTAYDPAGDFVRIPMAREQLLETVERFTIEVGLTDGGGGVLALSWDASRFTVPIEVSGS